MKNEITRGYFAKYYGREGRRQFGGKNERGGPGGYQHQKSSRRICVRWESCLFEVGGDNKSA